MSGESIAFIHASDFHLEQPPYGLTDVPDHLRQTLVDAPLQAAARVFETAILEDVDFVLLCGDVLDPQTAGPRAMAFLLDQFELLHEQRIPVFWAAGRVDAADRWPDESTWPENVQVFPRGQLKQCIFRRNDHPVATIIGISSSEEDGVDAGDFRIEPTDRFTVAVAYGPAEASSLAGHKQIDYWALGGLHQTKTLFQSPQTACYSGSPQGRSLQELAPHGCLLGRVERGRTAQMKFVPTDSVRWSRESIALPESTHRNDLQRHLRSRMQRIASEASGCSMMVGWEIQTEGSLASQLRGGLDRELVDWLRTEFGRAQPVVWTTEMSVKSSAEVPEESYEEDTILGDFLRAVREHQRNEVMPLDFAAYLPDRGRNRTWAALLDTGEQVSRPALLEEAAALGADLLRGEEVL
ncbi:MAG: DNA repair exonuclease [Planctomycetes bacterium]|nr:DNA repair exonuclease [Planctomycetota bacterium]